MVPKRHLLLKRVLLSRTKYASAQLLKDVFVKVLMVRYDVIEREVTEYVRMSLSNLNHQLFLRDIRMNDSFQLVQR
jgi:hypothetical protein